MSQNVITQSDLTKFQKSRREFDKNVCEILGNDIHLHDLSSESDHTIESNSFNSFGKPKKAPAKNNGREKFDEFYQVVDNENKKEKLYKQNVELQKKIMRLKEENKEWRHGAEMWEKTRKYIVENVHPALNLKSVKYKSSDSSILEQFFVSLEQIIYKKTASGLEFGSDHTFCKATIEQLKRKAEKEKTDFSRLQVENEKLKEFNKFLSEKLENLSQEKKQRISQLQQEIGQKFSTMEKNLSTEKNKDIDNLKKKIVSLEIENMELRQLNKKRQKQISTNPPESVRDDRSEIEILKRLSLIREEELNQLKSERRSLEMNVNDLEKYNGKLKKIISLAKKLNDDFIARIEEGFKKGQAMVAPKVESQYYITGSNFKPLEPLHMVNKRFKIIKSKSMQSERSHLRSKKKSEIDDRILNII